MSSSAVGIEVSGLVVERDGVTVLKGIDLSIPPGAMTVLLGANGAGKTTLIEAISGAVDVKDGSIEMGGTNLRRIGRARRARSGLAHVEQGHTVFGDLTVSENLTVAARGNSHDDAYDLFPQLAPRRDLPSRHLSGGEQQMLVLARALISNPKVLMVDEMSMGLAPAIAQQLIGQLAELANQGGTTVLLVEQFASLALRHGSFAYVLAHGAIGYHGPCADLRDHPDRLHEAYFSATSTQRETAPNSEVAHD